MHRLRKEKASERPNKPIPFMVLHKAPPIAYDEPYPLFNRIAIETHSKCNRKCSFCPVASGRRDFPGQQMDKKLFKSICSQLAELKFDGFIEFFMLNEPLLDPKLLSKARLLRKSCPKSTIYISTNGDVLDKRVDRLDHLAKIFASGINSVNINIYDAGEEQKQRYNQFVDTAIEMGICKYNPSKYQKKPARGAFVHLSDMRPDRVEKELSDTIFSKSNEDRKGLPLAPNRYCARVHRHLVIAWDGSVPICCSVDPTHPDTPIVGNVKECTLLEIWNSETFAKYRYFLQQADRRSLTACRTCTAQMAYPFAVRHIAAPISKITKWNEEEAE